MSFAEYFNAAWNKDPFPWQIRLAEQVLSGRWPRSIGLPTAAGKTALIDIAVYALAMGAPGAARRIFFVVDRRIIVDEAAERARELAGKLKSAAAGSELGKVAALLREIGDGPDSDPLGVAALRGGIARSDFWKYSPRQPLIVCSTVDQVGSSLLFRGYGASEYARPLRAALVAYDALIIVDEAHTSQPFVQTLEHVHRYRGWAAVPMERPFSVVEMSATPRAGEVFREDVFREDDADREHPTLRERWNVSKRTRLIVGEKTEKGPKELDDGEIDTAALAVTLAREARRMRTEHAAIVIGVIANRVRTARLVFDLLNGLDKDSAILLIGRSRPWDRDYIWNQWREFIGLQKMRRQERPVFVVATQCIEVGANIDFDALVTEIASIDALEQRFGRLNREGRALTSHAAIVALKEQTASRYEDHIYGKALSATWTWLKNHVTREERAVVLPAEGKKKPKTKKIREEFIEMGVLALRAGLESTENPEDLVCPRISAPVLMPAHMDLLCQTSPEPALTPEPAVFLHGPQTDPADVLVVWRHDIDPGNAASWINTVAICPPSAAEAVSLPVWAVRQWLRNKAVPDFADIEGGPAPSREERESPGGQRSLCWRGIEESVVLLPGKIRPGMTLVVPSGYGGCDDWGWNPESTDTVRDVGDAVKSAMGKPMLRLNGKLAEAWRYVDLAKGLRACETAAEAIVLLAGGVGTEAEAWVRDTVGKLASSRLRLVDDADSESEDWVAVAARGKVSRDSVEAPLDSHLIGCREWASFFATGLPGKTRATVLRAAELHDIGKADPRFQAWLRGGNPIQPREFIAKSRSSHLNAAGIEKARVRSGYPKGGRHELTSVAMLLSATEGADIDAEIDKDLLLHLVGSHHGSCRPFAPVVEDLEPVLVRYRNWSASSDHRLETAGSGVSERFWKLTRLYGWYGLAWLESLVRLSDYAQSAEEQRKATRKAEMANA